MTIFDNILLELASCAKRSDAAEADRLWCIIDQKYKDGLLTACEFYALHSVAFCIGEEAHNR